MRLKENSGDFKRPVQLARQDWLKIDDLLRVVVEAWNARSASTSNCCSRVLRDDTANGSSCFFRKWRYFRPQLAGLGIDQDLVDRIGAGWHLSAMLTVPAADLPAANEVGCLFIFT